MFVGLIESLHFVDKGWQKRVKFFTLFFSGNRLHDLQSYSIFLLLLIHTQGLLSLWVQYKREVEPIESLHCLDRGTGKK